MQDAVLRNKNTAAIELKCAPLSTRIGGLMAKINWVQVGAAMAAAYGIPFDFNAGIDANELVIPPGL
jgi:hypothetical protein